MILLAGTVRVYLDFTGLNHKACDLMQFILLCFFLSVVYNAYACFYLCCLQAISVLLVALNIVYLLVDETAMPKGSTVREMSTNM